MNPRTITIEPVLYGFKVRVGCTELVFRTRKELLSELKRYLTKPAEIEKEYLKYSIHKLDQPESGIAVREEIASEVHH